MNSDFHAVSFAADEHPDENWLLLALEHELSVEEVQQIEQHLGSCWSCRVRSEEIQRGILAFMEYREKRYLPSLPVPPHDYTDFPRRLRAITGEGRQENLLARIWRKIVTSFTLPIQIRWVSIVATAMALILFWAEVLRPPTISADELLTRATMAQNPPALPQRGGPFRVAHQRVQIRSERQLVVRDFEWTVGRPIGQAQWESSLDPLQWRTPLTAESFAGWRSSLREKKEVVKRSGRWLTLSTTTSRNFLREAILVVRVDDFHPVEQHLRFADHRQLDITELSFEIHDQMPAQSQPVAPTHTVPDSSRKPPSVASLPSPGELEEAELQLRYTLFTHGWDLGEDLLIERGRKEVLVSGVVSSPAREKTMQATLSSLPHLQLSFRAPGGLPGSHSSSHPASAARGQTLTSAPLLRNELETAFPSREERLAFTDRCLTVSDAALSHAWALKRLVDRYGEEAESRLEPPSRVKLREMLHTHLQRLKDANAGLQPLLALLPFSKPDVATIPENWRSGLRSLFARVQQQDRLVAYLVVGTQENGQDPPGTAANYRATHEEIEAVVRSSLKELAQSRSVP